MQPTYLPWMGYFDLIDQSDLFVFLDSVEFNDRSWQQRNRIKVPGDSLWLTVPVLTKGRRHQVISDVIIDKSRNFNDKHLRTIGQFYRKAPFHERCMEVLQGALQKDHDRLADLNTDLILFICRELGIKTEFVRSSTLGVEGRKTELLVDICKKLGARRYLSAAGSREYIEENDLFTVNGIGLAYHEYAHPEYRQLHGAFVPYLSVVDLLMNEGPDSLSIIRSGRSREADE